MGVETLLTYIIETLNGEFYCGKTEKILQIRLTEHEMEKYPRWFASLKRKQFKLLYSIKGDYEKKIKKFGIKNFAECINSLNPR